MLAQKHQLCFILILLSGLIVSSCNSVVDTNGSAGELKMKARWVNEHLIRYDPQIPFSFTYDGKTSLEWLKIWKKETQTKKLDKSRTQYTQTWNDQKTGMEIRCESVEYSDYPAIEWTVYFKNAGTGNSLVLKDIQGIDVQFEKDADGEFVLHGNKGDWCAAESYEPFQLLLAENTIKRFSPSGGRPTNGPDGWPYYNIQMPGGGVTLAVGWPGQWSGSFIRDGYNSLQVTAGQELTDLYLMPGEEIRTPLIALQFWQGTDVVRSQNLWRRWMIAHNLPRTADGNPPVPMYIFCSGGFFPGLNVSESSEKQFIDILTKEKIKIDYWWMDAGWYPCGGQWPNTGTWEPDTTRFPTGIKAVSDYAHARDMKLIVWFEPERVGDKNSWLARNHPEWLLGERLLNIGNPNARKWLTGHIDSLINTQGIDLYRQDFNMDPLNYWRSNDSLHRTGITENLYVQGYLAYWDELRRRHPGMLIDACASGGRRNDLETMRRAVPLLRSDYQAFDGNLSYAAGNQGHTYGLSSWLPFYGHGVYQNEQYMSYYVRSHISPSFGICLDVRKPGIDWNEYRRLVSQWREVADCMLGDYFPLTPYSLDADQWIAWQFNRPEQGDGMIQAFRRDSCDVPVKIFKLFGLKSKAHYKVINLDQGGPFEISGKELMEKGLKIEISHNPDATVISYKELM